MSSVNVSDYTWLSETHTGLFYKFGHSYINRYSTYFLFRCSLGSAFRSTHSKKWCFTIIHSSRSRSNDRTGTLSQIKSNMHENNNGQITLSVRFLNSTHFDIPVHLSKIGCCHVICVDVVVPTDILSDNFQICHWRMIQYRQRRHWRPPSCQFGG